MNFVIYAFFSLFLWYSPTKPAADAVLIETVRASIASGNAQHLSAHFAKNLELVIDTEQVEFTSLQAAHAELILRSFFRKYPPHAFQFVHKGASERMRYSTGTYRTDGHSFAVYVLMRQTTNQEFVINALHFRRE